MSSDQTLCTCVQDTGKCRCEKLRLNMVLLYQQPGAFGKTMPKFYLWQFVEVTTSENAQNGQCRCKRAYVSVLGLVPLGLNFVPIRSHFSFIGRCPRYFIIGR
ncbi:hypothetical protein T07_514 [Trichinella nelsoni]|uniref:Uncharacterized protein n=1 Tax=Trichinella nelsoni TaxID=6336 RepID=A0A0V0RYJ9_9BILA|nr:hypothetical protein T07_514 [Trichinella nelsoni]